MSGQKGLSEGRDSEETIRVVREGPRKESERGRGGTERSERCKGGDREERVRSPREGQRGETEVQGRER